VRDLIRQPTARSPARSLEAIPSWPPTGRFCTCAPAATSHCTEDSVRANCRTNVAAMCCFRAMVHNGAIVKQKWVKIWLFSCLHPWYDDHSTGVRTRILDSGGRCEDDEVAW